VEEKNFESLKNFVIIGIYVHNDLLYIKEMERNYFIHLGHTEYTIWIYKIIYIKILKEFNSIKKHELPEIEKKKKKRKLFLVTKKE